MAVIAPCDEEQEARARNVRHSLLVAIAGALMTALLLALGVWQLQRLEWKLGLIERVEAQRHAAPVPPPTGPWTDEIAARSEYRPVRVTGQFRHEAETLVQAVTEHGGGYWVMTPLVQANGLTVLINRGFVPNDRADRQARAASQITGETTVTGLLRLSEPGGGFLRTNDPAADRWYSRDVAAIAAARGLPAPAPYFIDADASANAGGYPAGGLTVLTFRNPHLGYALTWFALAMMCAGGTFYVLRDDIRRRRSAGIADLATAARSPHHLRRSI